MKKISKKDQAVKTTSNFEKHTSKNPLKQFFFKRFEKNLISLVAPLGPKKILDTGCGEGFTLSRFFELKIGEKLEGIDFSKDAIRIGKGLYPNLDIKIGDIYNLQYKNSSFDLVTCMEVMEHLDNPAQALREVVRVSSKYILLTAPNEPLFSIFNYTRWGQDIGHINKWSSTAFEKFIVQSSKLKVIEVRYPFPWTMILAKKVK